jgi:DTW domain-containing protein YfiP
VSTLEAVAYFLELVEGINSKPLHNLFDYMQQQQIKLMPEDVKQRYR